MKSSDKRGIQQKKNAAKRESCDVTADFEHVLENKKTERYVLRLYVAGNNTRSQTAVENVKKICDDYLAGRYELEGNDIYTDKAKDPGDLVLAAPTLIKKLPLPLRRIIGDMTRKEKVLIGLDIVPRE